MWFDSWVDLLRVFFGVLALALLAGLQFPVAWVSHWPWVRPALTSRPAVLLQGEQLQYGALRRKCLSEAEVRQTVRIQGVGDVSTVGAVVWRPTAGSA